MYMDISSWDLENRTSFEQTVMTMSSSTHANSLPPLHQAIPEFHSHNPQERRSSSVPRKLAERGSPSFEHPHRTSPPSSTIDTRTYENEGSYDANTYIFPGHLDSRRVALSPTTPQLVMDQRKGSYLPPVSSLTSSRGSSFELERPSVGIPAPLPMLYNSHQQSHTSYGAHYEHEAMRSQQTTPDHHHRYSSGGSTISPSPYPSSSPIGSYSQPHYYSYGTNSRPTTAGYAPQPASQGEARAPFSPTGPVELSMDHFDQARSGKRRRGNLPKQVTDLLRSWLNDHLHHPYPTEDEKQMLMNQTGLTIHQISNWFINARRRRLPAITGSEKSSHSRRPNSGP